MMRICPDRVYELPIHQIWSPDSSVRRTGEILMNFQFIINSYYTWKYQICQFKTVDYVSTTLTSYSYVQITSRNISVWVFSYRINPVLWVSYQDSAVLSSSRNISNISFSFMIKGDMKMHGNRLIINIRIYHMSMLSNGLD